MPWPRTYVTPNIPWPHLPKALINTLLQCRTPFPFKILKNTDFAKIWVFSVSNPDAPVRRFLQVQVSGKSNTLKSNLALA